MKLASLLKSENIELELSGEDAQTAIANLVNLLVSSQQIKESHRSSIIEALYAREHQVSTGIGSGVAIPHAFSADLDEVIVMLGRSRPGIDFESIDNAPVHFVVLLLIPEKKRHIHLQTLATTAKIFKKCGNREKLDEASTPAEVIELIENCEK